MVDITLSVLLAEIGDDNLSFQILAETLTGARSKRGGLTEVSFVTDAITPGDVAVGKLPRVGFIVWVEPSRVQAARAALIAKATGSAS